MMVEKNVKDEKQVEALKTLTCRLLLSKHMDYRQKDSCFPSNDCSRQSSSPARPYNIISLPDTVGSTKCG